jgi:hypothetical protein
MRALCYYYGVELHNFAPNAISQAATFVGVCEGYLGIPINWELWIHLFRAELFTQPTTEQRTRRAVRAGEMSLALRGQFKDDYIPCTMTTNNAGWERGWFYLQASYNSSEQELQELHNAALETCRVVEEGEAQAGSSLASLLRALGGHVTERMHRALHLGVQKALGVVRSHYEVNFEALAEGYVIPEGVEDEVAMERVDALAADTAGSLAEAFEEFLFPDAADAAVPPA